MYICSIYDITNYIIYSIARPWPTHSPRPIWAQAKSLGRSGPGPKRPWGSKKKAPGRTRGPDFFGGHRALGQKALAWAHSRLSIAAEREANGPGPTAVLVPKGCQGQTIGPAMGHGPRMAQARPGISLDAMVAPFAAVRPNDDNPFDESWTLFAQHTLHFAEHHVLAFTHNAMTSTPVNLNGRILVRSGKPSWHTTNH